MEEHGGDAADGQRKREGDRGKEVETREQYAASVLREKCRCHNTQMENRINRYCGQDMWSYPLDFQSYRKIDHNFIAPHLL